MNGKKNNEKGVFSFPFLFSGSGQKNIDDGRLGTGKAEKADNIVSFSLCMAPELCGCLAARREEVMEQGLRWRHGGGHIQTYRCWVWVLVMC